jgi:hypothetical protein
VTQFVPLTTAQRTPPRSSGIQEIRRSDLSSIHRFVEAVKYRRESGRINTQSGDPGLGHSINPAAISVTRQTTCPTQTTLSGHHRARSEKPPSLGHRYLL